MHARGAPHDRHVLQAPAAGAGRCHTLRCPPAATWREPWLRRRLCTAAVHGGKVDPAAVPQHLGEINTPRMDTAAVLRRLSELKSSLDTQRASLTRQMVASSVPGPLEAVDEEEFLSQSQRLVTEPPLHVEAVDDPERW